MAQQQMNRELTSLDEPGSEAPDSGPRVEDEPGLPTLDLDAAGVAAYRGGLRARRGDAASNPPETDCPSHRLDLLDRSPLRELSPRPDILDASLREHRPHRGPHDREIQPEAPVPHVVEVEGELRLETVDVVDVAVTHLGPAGDAGLVDRPHTEVGKALGDLVQELGALGSRSDDTHLALQHVPELGQLVDVRA